MYVAVADRSRTGAQVLRQDDEEDAKPWPPAEAAVERA